MEGIIETVLSGKVGDVAILINDLSKSNTIVTTSTTLTTKSYWDETGTKVLKSDDAHLTILVKHKTKQ